ncbi:MAG: hypothetical protein JNK56_25045, partial [Myxococcales bacterium]|nr:hypothetical protein [Myxococcales bacterium]
MRVPAHLSHGPRSPVLALLLLASGCFAPTGKDPSSTTEASSSAPDTSADTAAADPSASTAA